MTFEINRRAFLQALIAAGASYTLPVKATKAQVDKVWAAAQANPWFFDVNDHGTLVDADIPEPKVWADVFDITTSESNDIESLIREIQSCPPLSSYMDRVLENEIESLEEELDEDGHSNFDYSCLKQKFPQLKDCRRFCPSSEMLSCISQILLTKKCPGLDELQLLKRRGLGKLSVYNT